jgi:hypothetical protein
VKGLDGALNTGWQGLISQAYSTEEDRYEAFFALFEEFLLTNPEKNDPAKSHRP